MPTPCFGCPTRVLIQVVVRKVNEEVDLAFVSESKEERMISKIVDKIVPKVEPSLLAIMPTVYVNCIKLALDETIPLKDRRNQISDQLRAELSEPLARELNERIDIPVLPEGLEGKLLNVVSNKVIDEFVEWTVGEVSDKFRGLS